MNTLSSGLPPSRPGFQWAAYIGRIDGYVSVDFARERIPERDYVIEEVPLPPPTAAKQQSPGQ